MSAQLSLVKPKVGAIVPRSGAALAVALREDLDRALAQSQERERRRAIREWLVGVVFAYWAHKTNRAHALLDPKRMKLLSLRLAEADDDASILCYAVDGALSVPYYADRPVISLIFRDRETVEELAGLRKKFREGVPHAIVQKYGIPETGGAE